MRARRSTFIGRRDFLRCIGVGCSVASVGLGTDSAGAQTARKDMDNMRASRDPVLVVFFQRGAADALHMIVPYRDKRYRSARESLALDPKSQPRDGSSAVGAMPDLGDGFVLHPALSRFAPAYRAGRLAAVVNVGSPDPTRSHFDAQDYMETGTPGNKATSDGWIARLVRSLEGLAPERRLSPFTAVALTNQLPRSLAGARDAIAMPDFSRLARRDEVHFERILRMYERDGSTLFADAGSQAEMALELFRQRRRLSVETRDSISYPRGRLGGALKQLAQMVRAELGIRIAFVDSSGWDTHFGQGGAQGTMARLMTEMSTGLTSFVDDVGAEVPVTVMTVTEFGRSVRSNGSGGTDHGHGSAMFVMGDGVRGGRLHGDWLSLGDDDLFEGRDLPVTTDFRDVFHEVTLASLGISANVELFPGYRTNPIGLIG